MRRAVTKWVLAAAGVIFLSVLPVRADVIITVDEVGSNVVTTGSGSFDITDLTLLLTASESPSIKANEYIDVGAPVSQSTELYRLISGPSSLGSGTTDFKPTSGSGDGFGMQSTFNLQVPAGYVSGQSLSGTDTYVGQSFSSLGLTPGTYLWTWGSGIHADSLTIQIGPAAPLPSSLAGGSVLLAMAGMLAWRRRVQA